MPGIQLQEQAHFNPQQSLQSSGICRVYPAHSSHPAACPPGEPPSALGVFADCTSSEEDDTDLLQAATEAELQLQDEVPDRAQANFPVINGSETVMSCQPDELFTEQEAGMSVQPRSSMQAGMLSHVHLHAHLTEDRADAGQCHMQHGIPGVHYECSNLGSECQASQQLGDTSEPVFQSHPGMQADILPSQTGACNSYKNGPLDAFLAKGERPAPEDALDDLLFCDAGDTIWHTHSFSLQRQEGQAHSESVQRSLVTGPPLFSAQPHSFGDSDGQRNLDISADQAGWRSTAQHGSMQQLNSSAAAAKVVESLTTLDNPSRASAVRSWGLDNEALEDIHMVTDGSDDDNMQHNTFRQNAATATKARNVLAVQDNQKAPAHTAVGLGQEQTDDDALQSDWALEGDDSGGIIFDDTAVASIAAPGMQCESETWAVGHPDDSMGVEQQQMPSSSARAHVRQKRAREELRDKLIQVGVPSASHSGTAKHLERRCGIFSPLNTSPDSGCPELGVMQELLEDSGRSSRLEPLIGYMRDQLAGMPPDTDGLYPTSLLKLQQGSINAHVPGSEASQHRHMFALLTLVQRSNTGSAGAAILPIAGRWQLKLESAHSSKDVHIRRVMCG